MRRDKERYSVELIDVAASGVASQSSLSRWSRSEGAQAAVSGDFSRDFTIHTEEEEHPWWQLDLGAWYPVERVVIRNRRDPAYWDRTKTLQVEVSEDAENWTLLHAGSVFFGADDDDALRLPLAGAVPLRYIRTTLAERAPLHLNRVEVLVPSQVVRDRRLMESIGIDFSNLPRYAHGGRMEETYRVVASPTGDATSVDGLRVVRTGRFANNVFQMSRALHLARARNLGFVQMFDQPLFDFSRPVHIDKTQILPHSAELPAGSVAVEGDYYYTKRFSEALGTKASSAAIAETARSCLLPFLNLPELPVPTMPDELLIHVRSGDLFGHRPHPDYGQPPLAFYTWAIQNAQQRGFSRVRVIAEDRLSPVVPGLEDYLLSTGIPHRMQIGEDLNTDLATLLSGRGLVFGVGTFGAAICMLAENVEVVYESSKNDQYLSLFPDLQIFSARPGSDYTTFSRWTKSPDQVHEMTHYPLEGFTFREQHGRHG